MDSVWFRRFAGPGTGDGTTPQLICFPHAGGAASAYVALSRALAADADVLAVQYPARQDRRKEEPATDLTALARTIADALARDLTPGRPYAFFGHSMGAILAYETARLLTQSAAPAPVRLFLSGRGAPAPEPLRSDLIEGDAELLAAIRRLGGTGQGILDEPELLEMALPALRADYRALGAYRWRPGPPLDLPFTVLVGASDPVVPTEDARGWLGHSTRESRMRVFPGGHFYLDEAVAEVADEVRTSLAAHAAV
ncbi:thioesterase II family protein [Streptomyces arboris]|uniref:thioesterase II family protein n=1 Tax=Streptomyces arboris TaxID=2600619 RepID=UPI003C309D53